MAYRVLRVCATITNSLKNCQAINNAVAVDLLRPNVLLVQNARTASFFNRRPAEQLWKGVTSVSNAGKRRGRAKGLARRKNLNKGQIIGMGKIPMVFPGLNAPVFRGKELVQQQVLSAEVAQQHKEKLIKLRDNMVKRKKEKLSPLERGWCGSRMDGRKIGPPDPIGEDYFEGFESWVLEAKIVSTMTGNLGRKMSGSAFVITGNGNGLAGFAVGRAPELLPSIKLAKNRAGQKLMHIERFNDHTVMHDFFAQFGNSKIFVRQMPPGFGLVCHRAVKACCEAIGIKDLYAKVEGSTNLQNIIKAFFVGLLKQKSYQTMANEKKLHLVQMRKENDYYPEVLASPAVVRKPEDIPPSENLNFRDYILDGKVRLQKPKYQPFFTKLPSWQTHLRKAERLRDQQSVRLQLQAEYGEIRSFLTEKYPECVTNYKFYKPKDEEAVEE